MDSHFKREVFKIFDMNEKNWLISFLKLATKLSIIHDSKENDHVTYHVTYKHNSNTFKSSGQWVLYVCQISIQL